MRKAQGCAFLFWGRGGIGRRAGLRNRFLRECGFESHRPHFSVSTKSIMFVTQFNHTFFYKQKGVTMKNLIPIVIYLACECGLTDEEIAMLEKEGINVYEKTGKFIFPLEYEVDDYPEKFGMMAPKEAHLAIKDRDDIIYQLIDHAFDDLVQFMYWDMDEETFYVKHPTGEIVLFSRYVRLKKKSEEFLAELEQLGQLLESDPCEGCEIQEECEAFNQFMEDIGMNKFAYDVEQFPTGIMVFRIED